MYLVDAPTGSRGPASTRETRGIYVASVSDVQAKAYQLANSATPYDENAAIVRKWLDLKKNGTYIGVPIGDETPLDDLTEDGGANQVAQAFTSGVVLIWRGGDKVDIA
jgi:hypothetical protein